MDIGLSLCNAIIAAVVFRVIAVYTYVEVIVSCTAPFMASYVYTKQSCSGVPHLWQSDMDKRQANLNSSTSKRVLSVWKMIATRDPGAGEKGLPFTSIIVICAVYAHEGMPQILH